MDHIRYIVCAGGGTRGLLYFGMIDALSKHMKDVYHLEWSALLNQVDGFAGTSIGALISLIFMLKLTPEQVRHLSKARIHNLRSLVPCPDISMLFTDFGLENGMALRELIHDVIRCGGLCESITFEEMRRLLNADYVCVATDAHTRKPVYFSAANTPDIRISDAVFMSMCVPFLFVPIKNGKHYCVDGSLSHNIPMCYPPAKSLHLVFNLDNQVMNITTLHEYMYAIFSMTTEPDISFLNEAMCLRLQMPQHLVNETPMDFDIGEASSQSRMRCGYYSALMFMFPSFADTFQAVLKMACHAMLGLVRSAADN